MFRIVRDPPSGSTELYLTEIIRSGSQMFVVCLVGVWQRNFEPVVCVYGGPGSVVDIATTYGLDGPGIESRFSAPSRPALRPTQPPVLQWVPGLPWG